jgi:hypothetical protein
MYLKKILIKNVGPIDQLDGGKGIEMPFHKDGQEAGNPKPLLLVGKNGGGKTILISHIVDAIIEFQKQLFDDVVKGQTSVASPYFKFTGVKNQKLGTEFGLSFLQFSHVDKDLEYLDKSGKLSLSDTKKEAGGALNFGNFSEFEEVGNFKGVTQIDKSDKKIEADFTQNPYCFFPANRSEIPHWFNTQSADDNEIFNFKEKFRGKLAKPVVISSSLKENKAWIMDVVLDVAIRKEQKILDTISDFIEKDVPVDKNLWAQIKLALNIVFEGNDDFLWKQINTIIRKIIGQENIRCGIAHRTGGVRIQILEDIDNRLKTIVPSLDHLSAGETTLLNLFISILRYADQKPRALKDIEGIVVVDEIDLHLHTNLQAETLPNLIKLFPKIQFIITTHSPIFLLGMKKVFGEENFEIREMPSGERIETEKFGEFEKTFNEIINTKKFEDEILTQITKVNKPLVYVEGPTDVLYIKKAAEHLGFSGLLEKVGLEAISNESGDKNGGSSWLTKTAEVFAANPSFLVKNVLLIYDPDEKKIEDRKQKEFAEKTAGKLVLKILKESPDTPLHKNGKKIGIESLFLKSLIDLADHQDLFFKKNNTEEAGQTVQNSFCIADGCKFKLCDWICENATKEDFANFEQIFTMIREILNLPSSTNINASTGSA